MHTIIALSRKGFVLMLGIMGLGLFAPALAAEGPRAVPSSTEQIKLSFAPVVKNVAPAVVNIYTRKRVRTRALAPLFDDPIFQQFFGGGLQGGVTRERMERSLGSGVLVSGEGLIVTSHHVIAEADEITVVLSDRREFEATLVNDDKKSDLSVLKIDAGKGGALPHLALRDSDELEVGDLVLALGNPFGVGQTVTNGIVSALARTSTDLNDYNYFIQTDAAINPGNSGGALVTMDGKLAGINTAIYSRDGGNMGIGFAVPANLVRALLDNVGAGQKRVVRPWTGIEGQELTSDIAASLGLESPQGFLVKAVSEDSPAAKAGLKKGDLVLALNGKALEDLGAFRYRVATLPVGSEAKLDLKRGGDKLSLAFKLIAPPETTRRAQTQLKGRWPLAGAVVANLSPALLEDLAQDARESLSGARGVVVVKVAEGSLAAQLGLAPGDLILHVNNAAIARVEDLKPFESAHPSAWRLTLRRGGEVMTLMVRG